jgi:methionyl-tRNA synthetase
MPSKYIVTATPPTTNGDLHVGHLSGPYLAADVFCRAQRLLGHETVYVSGADDHQTYVVTTAERLGMDPRELAARSAREIRETLALADVAIDAFPSPDPRYVERVQGFFAGLFAQGKLAPRRLTFSYCPEKRRYLFEAYATGFCPECYGATCGAICEECGHPNDAESLRFGRSNGAAQGGTLERRELDILVLPLEAYRSQFEEHYRRHGSTMRPHVLRFVQEMLARPLPDFPLSYPGDWGVKLTIPGFTDQVVNVWAEMLPGLVYMTELGLRAQGAQSEPDPWRKESGSTLVQFMGYDNTFYFSLAHLGLALAHGQMITPTAIVTNEFYHLDGSKFSTSRRHLIWARDLVGRFGPDNARFYLALNNPEQQVANFTERDFTAVVKASLHEPLASLADALRAHAGKRVELDAEAHALFARAGERMARAYDLPTFSLRTAGQTLANLLVMLRELALRDGSFESAARVTAGLVYFAVHAAPLLPGLSSRLASALGLSALPSPGRLANEPLEVRVPVLDLSALVSVRF